MTEDDLYRSSSQYRYWSFTPEALEQLRASTNAAAAARVKAAIKRSGGKTNEQSNSNGASQSATNGEVNGRGSERDVECLTVEEEAKLVQYYCTLCLRLGDSFDFPVPINVKVRSYSLLPPFPLSPFLVLHLPSIMIYRLPPSNLSNASTSPIPP